MKGRGGVLSYPRAPHLVGSREAAPLSLPLRVLDIP